jgi:hypothetical protein
MQISQIQNWSPPVVLSAALPPLGWAGLRLRSHLRNGRRRRPGVCASCGDDLRATPGGCPECGRGIA